MRIESRRVPLGADEVVEVEMPEEADDAVHRHVQVRRFNNTHVELLHTQVIWEEADDQELLLASLEFLEDEPDDGE